MDYNYSSLLLSNTIFPSSFANENLLSYGNEKKFGNLIRNSVSFQTCDLCHCTLDKNKNNSELSKLPTITKSESDPVESGICNEKNPIIITKAAENQNENKIVKSQQHIERENLENSGLLSRVFSFSESASETYFEKENIEKLDKIIENKKGNIESGENYIDFPTSTSSQQSENSISTVIESISLNSNSESYPELYETDDFTALSESTLSRENQESECYIRPQPNILNGVSISIILYFKLSLLHTLFKTFRIKDYKKN